MINSTTEVVGNMARKKRLCTECGKEAPELSIYRRICDRCHKSVAEARARPHTETNTQKRARLRKQICSYFDLDYLERVKNAKEVDDKRRRERQAKIAERKNKEMAAIRKKKLENKPVYSLPQVHYYRTAIMDIFDKYECFGTGMEGKEVVKAAKSISRLTKIPYKVLHTTLSAYIGDYVSASDAKHLANRIAGNYITLRKNIPLINVASGTPVEGWALFRVIGVNNSYQDKKGIPGFNMFSEVITGVLADTVIKAGYSMNVCNRFGKKLGVKRNELQYFSPKFLTNMYGWAYIAEVGGSNRPRELDSNSNHKEHNRELIKGRMEMDKCPYKYKPNTYSSCLDCPVGYEGNVFSKCKYAVRRDKLTK